MTSIPDLVPALQTLLTKTADPTDLAVLTRFAGVVVIDGSVMPVGRKAVCPLDWAG